MRFSLVCVERERERKRERERERESEPFWLKSTCRFSSLWGGALEDGPPRLLAVPSNLGGWTFLQAEVGLSRIPAATLLQRPFGGVRSACNNREGNDRTLQPWRGPGYRKTFDLHFSAGEVTVHYLLNALTFPAPLIVSYFNAGRGTPSSTSP